MWLFLAACTAEYGTVEMYGTVHDAPNAKGELVAGATLTVLDELFAPLDETTTNADGSFGVGTPAGQAFYLEMSGEGFVSTHFSGTAGVQDFTAGDGYPWIAPTTWIDDLREEFSACPTAADAGAVVAGDVRLYINGVASLETLPPVGTAEVAVYTQDGDVAYPACYLDDDGASVADGDDTGKNGEFAVFGVPEGPIAVELIFEDSDQLYPSILYSFVVADGGFVPLYPALVYEGDL